MKYITIGRSLATAALLACSATAFAQYAGPAAAAYAGPSSVPTMTAKQLRDTGRDDQYARLVGHIVSHDGGENYTFADESGRLRVEISPKYFPAGQPITAAQRVELLVEVDSDFVKKEFEVKQIWLLP
jgi:uncharacterized protein (TIGR00156 family)